MDAQFQFLSVPETADILGVTTGRVRQLLRDGTLQGHKVGDFQWAIADRDVKRFAKQPRSRMGRPRISDSE